jgi:hypothetical protein
MGSAWGHTGNDRQHTGRASRLGGCLELTADCRAGTANMRPENDAFITRFFSIRVLLAYGNGLETYGNSSAWFRSFMAFAGKTSQAPVASV